MNNFLFHFDTFLNNIPPCPQDVPTTDPQLNLTNELIFPDLADGANFNLPQATHLNRYQFSDAFTWTPGKHTLRAGVEMENYTAHGVINVFGTGTIILTQDFGTQNLNGTGNINDLDIPVAVGIKSSAPVTPVPIPDITNNYYAAFVQDDWKALSNLTLNLGLRYEYDSNLTGNNSAHDPCPNLTTTPTVPCVWMANVIDLKKIPGKKDFGPRIGFVYDPFRRGETTIRGGYGIYYDRIILEAGSEELVQNDRALMVTQYAGSVCTSPHVPGAPTLSKTLDYSDDDQLTNNNVNEQVDIVEGINNLRLEKRIYRNGRASSFDAVWRGAVPLEAIARSHLYVWIRRACRYISSGNCHQWRQRFKASDPVTQCAGEGSKKQQ